MSRISLRANTSGTGTVTLVSPDTNTNLDFILPSTHGANGQVLRTNGSGGLSFATSIPSAGTAKTSPYTLVTSDIGEFIEVGGGGSITIPDGVFSAGDAALIFNNTTTSITITCSIATAYIAGTNSDKNSVTLATRGVASILFVTPNICVISGNVS